MICADSITPPTSALVRLSASAVAVTSTVSVVPPDLQLASMVRVSPYLQIDLVDRRRLESGLGDGDGVGAHGQGVVFVEPPLARGGCAVKPGGFGFEFHRGPRDQRSRRIRHCPIDRGPILGECGNR